MSAVQRIYEYHGIREGCLRRLEVVQMLERVARVSYGSHHINDEGPRRLGTKVGAPEALVLYNLLLQEGTSSVALRTIGSIPLFGWFIPLSPPGLSGHTN